MSQRTPHIFGTKEWAPKNANCVNGCAHNCHYCYAKSMAIRFRRKTPTTWKNGEPHLERIGSVCRGKPTRVMFPSTHDITPAMLPVCLSACQMMLDYGHELLIVSKPHPECIKAICDRFGAAKDRILFRFTVGSADNIILRFWEPEAPTFEERLKALHLAHRRGFQTSVSCEPMLDDHVGALVSAVSPFVTDAIWIGKANQLRQRLKINGAPPEVQGRGEELIASQGDQQIRTLYDLLKDNSQVKWKESIKKVVGLKIPDAIGLDV